MLGHAVIYCSSSSSAVLDPRFGRIMHDLSPFVSVLRCPEYSIQCHLCPVLDVVYPRCLSPFPLFFPVLLLELFLLQTWWEFFSRYVQNMKASLHCLLNILNVYVFSNTNLLVIFSAHLILTISQSPFISKAVIWSSLVFFTAQLSHPYMATGRCSYI